MHHHRFFAWLFLAVLLATFPPQASLAKSVKASTGSSFLNPDSIPTHSPTPAPMYQSPTFMVGPKDPIGLPAVGSDGGSTQILRCGATRPRAGKPGPVPIVPGILLGTLAASVVIWGVRVIAVKKRAPLWVVGIIAGALVMIVGLSWSGLTQIWADSADACLLGRHPLEDVSSPIFL